MQGPMSPSARPPDPARMTKKQPDEDIGPSACQKSQQSMLAGMAPKIGPLGTEGVAGGGEMGYIRGNSAAVLPGKDEKMGMVLVWYPKCSTCQRAKRFLEENGVPAVTRDIKEERLSAEELRGIWRRSGLPLKRFFNTSGLKYKELGLKDRLPSMSEEEQVELLSSDGMIVKRPLLVGEDFVLVGFREAEWRERLGG